MTNISVSVPEKEVKENRNSMMREVVRLQEKGREIQSFIPQLQYFTQVSKYLTHRLLMIY